MPVNMRALRQKLLARGLTLKPVSYQPTLTRQQYRDCLSQCVEACDRHLAIWWATQPENEYEREHQDRRADYLRIERQERWDELLAMTPNKPGYPHDGFEI